MFLTPTINRHLGNAEVAGGHLPVRLLHLAVALRLKVFQVVAALHHGLHLRLYLADVEASYGELLLYHAGDLHGLMTDETVGERETFERLPELPAED